MKYKDVIYPVISSILQALMEKLNDVLEQQENDALTNIYVHLDPYGSALDPRTLSEIAAYIENPEISGLMQQIAPDNFRKLEVLLTLSRLLDEDQNLDIESNIDMPIIDFKIIEDVGPELPFKVFGFANNVNKIDSIGYFHFADKWEDALSESNFNNALLASAIYIFNENIDIRYDKRYILVRSDANNECAIQATLRLQAIMHGKSIHRPIESQIRPSLVAANRISALKAYHQFDESILILSEFNSRSEMLNKFLSIYHVLEGFMYKIPIGQLGASNGGKMFSIRDFKRLYTSVGNNELNALQDVLKEFWNIRIGAQAFNKIVTSSVASLQGLPTFNMDEFNLLLAKIGVGKTYNEMKNINYQSYAKLIYKVRCAVVHNNETEFHISHFNFSKMMECIFDEILMKPLEIIIYDRIADESSCIWYKGSALQLYHAQ